MSSKAEGDIREIEILDLKCERVISTCKKFGSYYKDVKILIIKVFPIHRENYIVHSILK